ncbi:hypothetical protein FB567DRAFT_576830 [Paraphoma chrysanthemicola]|uniref:Uncharacterized protein n=1 Tax=Paraphoma chrysanthemicola TaxID=798071 RepID=A0A8K0RFW9_9PLEO|nr:hypothetical protein FB567DRAFT_576830 [Paraphoma chrysanthemicola]
MQAIAAGEVVDQKQFSLQNVVLGAVAQLEATRPEDRIFSLYGLCRRLGYELPLPNYTRDLADLLLQVAHCFFKYDRKLKSLMVTSGTTSVMNGLPSWVLSTRALWQPSQSGLKVPSMLFISGPGCLASGTSIVDFQLHGNRLRVKGRVFDCIAELGDMLKVDMDLDDQIPDDACHCTDRVH